MRNLSPGKWIQNLTDQQKDVLLGLFIASGVAILYYFQWAYYLTGFPDSKVNIDQPARYFWWANDSVTYRETGEWLFGRSDSTQIANRPWLYPFLLGLVRTLFDGNAESVMWIGQFLMWLVSGVLIYLALQNGTHSTILSILGAGIFYSHPSPLILTFHGMTETLNILLIAILCWVMTTKFESRLYTALLLLSLATVVKPIYLVFLVLFVIYLGLRSRTTPRMKQTGMIALMLAPIWIQLLLSFLATGRASISDIGAYTFKNYWVADVYQHVEGITWRESTTAIENWDLRDQLNYLWMHQRETALAYRRHVIDDNLWTGSFFALGEGNRLDGFARTMNGISLYIHLLMLPLIIYYLSSAKYRENSNRETISLLYFCFIIQLLTSGISTGQEDRLMVTALPLWIVAYFLTLSNLPAYPPKLSPDA